MYIRAIPVKTIGRGGMPLIFNLPPLENSPQAITTKRIFLW